MNQTGIRTPVQNFHDRLLRALDPDAPIGAALFGRSLQPPTGLGPMTCHNLLNTLLLALEGYKSPYWAPKGFYRKHLGLDVADSEQGTLVYFWKTNGTGPPALATYPVYNLEQASGDKSRLVLSTLDEPPQHRDVSENVRALIGACPDGPTILFAKHPQKPVYDLATDTLHLGSNGAAHSSPSDHYPLIECLVAATAKNTERRLHPPARELFVITLTSAFVAHGCGFRSLPKTMPGASTLCRSWIQSAGMDLFHAASDANDAYETVHGWRGRTEALYPDQLADCEYAR